MSNQSKAEGVKGSHHFCPLITIQQHFELIASFDFVQMYKKLFNTLECEARTT